MNTPQAKSSHTFTEFFQPNSNYWHSRNWTRLRYGVPAIAFGLLLLAPLVLFPFLSNRTAKRYEVQFNRAIRGGSYETANLFRMKLDELSETAFVRDEEYNFNSALTSIGIGDTKRGEQLLSRLAPTTSSGYGPAHRWVANQYMTLGKELTKEQFDALEHHLKSAMEFSPQDPELQLALGSYYQRRRDNKSAITHLNNALEKYPSLNFVLATLYESVGDEQEASKHFRDAIPVLEKAVADDPENLESLTNLAWANYKLNQFGETVRVLTSAMQENRDIQGIQSLLSNFYVQEFDRIQNAYPPESPEYAASLLLLSKALEFAPSNEQAINRLAYVSSLSGEEGKIAKETLTKLLAGGSMPATAHVILGTAEFERGQLEKARLHFSQAYRLNPDLPPLLNNFSWMLAHQDPPKLEQALRVINVVMEKANQTDPYLHYYLDTRGQIYVLMARWEEAIADLEMALRKMPENVRIHRSLARAYRELGQIDLAREHEERNAKKDN